MQYKKEGGVPRVLADDISFTYAGADQAERTIRTMRDTEAMVKRLGGKRSRTKSYAFATSKIGVARLRNKRWEPRQTESTTGNCTKTKNASKNQERRKTRALFSQLS